MVSLFRFQGLAVSMQKLQGGFGVVPDELLFLQLLTIAIASIIINKFFRSKELNFKVLVLIRFCFKSWRKYMWGKERLSGNKKGELFSN